MPLQPDCKEFDYYAILNVPRDATSQQIALAYRKQAPSCHPHRDKTLNHAFNPPEGVYEQRPLPALSECAQWSYINRAYDILSHGVRREVYDRFGESGLNKGVPLPSGYFQPYTYHGDYLKTYHDVFGTYSPYSTIIDAVINPPPLCSTSNGIGVKKRDKPVEKVICLELRDIFFGSIKRMTILRHEFVDGDKTKTEIREKVLVVPIAPGTEAGTRIRFKEEGDQYPTKIPADIIFITADKHHDVFLRKQNDLHMDYDIDLKQALCGFNLFIKTIDDRKLSMLITDVIEPGYAKEILKEGLPILNKRNEKGNLYVHFNVKFPKIVPRDLRMKFNNLFNELKNYEIEEEKIPPSCCQ